MHRHLSQALNLKDRPRQRMVGKGKKTEIMQRVEENEEKIIFSEW